MRQEIHVSSHLHTHTHTHTSNTLQELIFQKGSGLVGAFVAACARASHICVTDTNDATILGAGAHAQLTTNLAANARLVQADFLAGIGEGAIGDGVIFFSFPRAPITSKLKHVTALTKPRN
jgi:hypothetical protein